MLLLTTVLTKTLYGVVKNISDDLQNTTAFGLHKMHWGSYPGQRVPKLNRSPATVPTRNTDFDST